MDRFVTNLTCGGARSAGCGKTCAFTSLGARRCGNSSLLVFSSTLLLRTRRKTRPCLTLHPPVAFKPCLTVDKSILLWYILYVMENYCI